MTDNYGDCKKNLVEIARSTCGTPTAKLVAILVAHGVTSAAELAEIVGISDRAIRKVRNHSSGTTVPPGTTGPELQDRPGTTVPKTELQDRNYSSAIARAYKESPTEIGSLVKDKNIMSETVVSDNVVKMQPRAKRRHSYTPEFEAFWSAYPAIGNNSKSEAFKQWRLLLPAEQLLAREGLQHLAAHCRANPTYTCVHACRYLSQRRWESYETPAQRLAPKPAPTPEWLIMQRIGEEMLRVNGEC